MDLVLITSPLARRGVKYIDTAVRHGLNVYLSARISEQEGLAVASIARDDPSTLSGDDPFPDAHMHRDLNKVGKFREAFGRKCPRRSGNRV